MVRLWKSVLKQYGQKLILRSPNGETHIRAFFQPVDEKAPGVNPTVLGLAPLGKYLYLGPPEQELTGVEELEWNGQFFRILRHREYQVGDETVYRWAVCEEMDASVAEVAG